MTSALFFTAKTEYPLHVHFYYSPRPTLYASQHCSLRVSPCTLYNQQPALYTINFNLHTPHSTLHNLHLTLHSLRFTLHTAHFPIATPQQFHAWFSPRAWHTKNNTCAKHTTAEGTRLQRSRLSSFCVTSMAPACGKDDMHRNHWVLPQHFFGWKMRAASYGSAELCLSDLWWAPGWAAGAGCRLQRLVVELYVVELLEVGKTAPGGRSRKRSK